MASMGHDQDSDDQVTLICSESNSSDADEKPDDFDAITVSTAEISSWDLPSILAHKVLKIEVNSNRLIEESSYFRGLLGGSFSESGLDSVSIDWNVESFVSVLRIICGCPVEISSENFIPLNEAALFFGVDKLLAMCGDWFAEVTSFRGFQSPQICLDGLIRIWRYGLQHANDFILRLCTSYLARNFMWALSFNSYTDVPYELLCSCIQHPDLTVDSEKHLCDAILVWLTANTTESNDWSSDDLCHKIHTTLLPLWFAADSDLLTVSEVCHSLSYVNMKGCISVSDHGISVMILNCKMLQSILACDTSFGNYSILAICSGFSSETQVSGKHSQLMASKLLTLHIGGCNGISGNVLSELMSGADNLRSLCLREIQLVDDALYRLPGVSLEMLDVSDTKVSYAALYHVICRNPDLKSIKARGCRHLLLQESETKERRLCKSSCTPEELYTELGKSCKLEEIELGWGFSYFSLGALKPAIRTLRSLVVGLGGSLGPDGLKLLPSICPMLETLILYFQVISDFAIINLIKCLPNLQVLALCYCFGGISSSSFKIRMPCLRNLRLERVTPWMTNEALATLAENCPNLVKLSLIGCTLLDSEAQTIILSGWPGLTFLHLEECGEITANGVRSLMDCHALEDLTIRHTGPGIPRNFIVYAASKLPMLRKISLDICDAKEGDFDLPSFGDRYYLSSVKIARCKLQKSSLGLHNLEARRRRSPVHRETLVMVWNSEKLTTTVVKERL